MKTETSIPECVELLRAGGVVGMPTETVYGLAADARRDDAVAKVFELKGRPSTNPLIVHVASVEIAERYAVVDERARKLFAAFAPGPLTIVLEKRESAHGSPRMDVQDRVCDLVSAGLSTVGIRIPDHPVALELLRAFDGPLAAPSANRSNHVSPTTAEHVRSEFGDAVPVLDGGACRVGIESTVLSLAMERPTILRPGSVSREAIESVIGPVEVFSGHVSSDTAASSPGQQQKHYAPVAPAFRCARVRVEAVVREQRTQTAQRSAWESIALIVLAPLQGSKDTSAIVLGTDPDAAARAFYAALRALDALHPTQILIEFPPDEPAWHALRDRIRRATVPLNGSLT